VFFASHCGLSRDRAPRKLVQAPPEEESDLRSLSVREAVNFAKQTNLLGVILEATTLVRLRLRLRLRPVHRFRLVFSTCDACGVLQGRC
jgi:CDK inhibitor PHO81